MKAKVMTKPRTKYAKVGEKVRIVTPKFFIRCGYPLTVEIVLEKYAEEIAEKFAKAVEVISPLPPKILRSGAPTIDRRTDQTLKRAIAYAIIRREGFGGRERMIYEQEQDHLGSWAVVKAGAVVEVESRQTVMTGTYSPGWSGYSYDGDYDYEPPTLDDAKAHVVYTLKDQFVMLNNTVQPARILAEHCERVDN